MPLPGDIISDGGKVKRWVSREPGQKDLYDKLTELNNNISTLIGIMQWSGQYDSFEKSIAAGKQSEHIKFAFAARSVNIRSDQRIAVRLNSRANPIITIDASESPFDLTNMFPNMLIRSVYITTYENDTRVRIIMFG